MDKAGAAQPRTAEVLGRGLARNDISNCGTTSAFLNVEPRRESEKQLCRPLQGMVY